jgi:uncharacterized protein (DUF3084 family)
MNEKIIDALPYIAPILTAIGAYKWDWMMNKLNLKDKNISIEGNALENLQKNLDLYQDMVTDLDKRYKDRIADFEQNFAQTMDRLRVEIDDLKKINSELEEMVKEQKDFITKQSKSLKYYESKFGKQ